MKCAGCGREGFVNSNGLCMLCDVTKDVKSDSLWRCRACGKKGVTFNGLCSSCELKANTDMLCKSCGKNGITFNGLCMSCEARKDLKALNRREVSVVSNIKRLTFDLNKSITVREIKEILKAIKEHFEEEIKISSKSKQLWCNISLENIEDEEEYGEQFTAVMTEILKEMKLQPKLQPKVKLSKEIHYGITIIYSPIKDKFIKSDWFFENRSKRDEVFVQLQNKLKSKDEFLEFNDATYKKSAIIGIEKNESGPTEWYIKQLTKST